MATTFAITGIHRSRLKHYRPSYQSDLPPIYEDAVQRQHFPASYSMPDNDDYIYLPSYMPSGRYYKQHEKRVHDYEEINAETLSRVNALPSTSLIKTSKTSMLDGIMSNRFQLKSTSLDKDTESDCDNKAVLQTDENTKNGAHKCPLRRKSTVYQVNITCTTFRCFLPRHYTPSHRTGDLSASLLRHDQRRIKIATDKLESKSIARPQERTTAIHGDYILGMLIENVNCVSAQKALGSSRSNW